MPRTFAYLPSQINAYSTQLNPIKSIFGISFYYFERLQNLGSSNKRAASIIIYMVYDYLNRTTVG